VDDTEAYEAARALDDVNAQLRLAVELGRIASWRRDLRNGRITFSDHQFELLGIFPRPQSLSVDELRALIHPDDLPLVAAANKQALETDEPVDSEARYRRGDGSWRYFLSRRVVERDGAGQPIAFVGVTLDTTERVEHLRHAEELARRPTRRCAPPASASGRRRSTRRRPTGTRRCSSCSTATSRRMRRAFAIGCRKASIPTTAG